MNHHSTWIALFFAVVAVSLVWLEDRPRPTSGEPALPDLIFPALSARNIEEISFNSASSQTSIRKGMHGWHVVYASGGRQICEDFADDELVTELLAALGRLASALPPRYVGQSRSDAWHEYGLGVWAQTRGDSLSVQYGNLRHTLYLGLQVADTSPLSLFYARIDEQERVVVVDAKVRSWLADSRDNPDFWRTRKVFHLASAQAKAVVWQSPALPEFTLRPGKQGWSIAVGGQGQTEPADPQMADRLVEALRGLRIRRFVYPEDLAAAERRLATALWIGYHSEEDQEYVAIAAAEDGMHPAARFYFVGDKRQLAYHYLLPATAVKMVQETMQRVRDRRLARFTPETVSQIVRSGSSAWKLAREGNEWWVTEPARRVVQSDEVRAWLRELSLAEATSIADDMTPALWRESLTLTLYQEPHTIRISWQQAETGDWPARVAPHGRVLMLAAAARNTLGKHYLDFYNKRLDCFSFADVVELHVARPGRVYEAVRDDSGWRLRQPAVVAGEAANIEDILRCVAWIMAPAVLGEGEEARRAFACDAAAYRLLVRTRAREDRPAVERTFELGNAVADGHYALWVSGFPFVYKVTGKLKEAMDRELHTSLPLLSADAWRSASLIELTRGDRRIRYENGDWRQADGTASAKGEKLWFLLPRLRIARVEAFTAAILPDRDADMVIRVRSGEREHVLWMWRDRDRIVATWPGSGSHFLIDNDAAAVLWQETE